MIEIPQWEYISNEDEAASVLEDIDHLREIAVDTETTGLNKWRDRVLFWSISDGYRRWCIPAVLMPKFEGYLQDPGRILVMHNANYDRWMLANSGVNVDAKSPRTCSRIHDTMVGHTLFYDDAPHDLKFSGPSMICEYNGIPKFAMPSFSKTFGRVPRGKTMTDVLMAAPLDKKADYASLDAWVTMRLYWELKKRLQRMELPEEFPRLLGLDTTHNYYLWDYFTGIEMQMLDVLYAMERRGVYIDTQYLKTLGTPIQQRLKLAAFNLARIAGERINVRSPKQLRKLFFETLGLKPTRWTKGGESGNVQPSTDAETLEQFAEEGVEAAKILLEFRKFSKLYDTYIKGILDPDKHMLDPNGRLHGSFLLHVARTGRLSSRDPNLQNIPIRTPEGSAIRGAYAAPPGYALLVADYAQLEPRITAGLSQDTNMCKAILDGLDYHCWTASLMFGEPYDEILAAKKTNEEDRSAHQKQLIEYRKRGKTIGLGLTYGMGPRKLANDLDIDVQMAKNYMDRYLQAYPGVRPFFDRMIEFTKEHEYIRTVLGRRRNLKGINSGQWGTYNEACRQAQNTPIQGHASEIMKMAQIRIFNDDDLWNAGARMIIQVHDEIVMEVPQEVAEDPWFVDRVRYHMERPFEEPSLPLDVGGHIPMLAEPKFGPTWLAAKD